MKTFLVSTLLCLVSLSASAQQINVGKLTEVQRAEIAATVAQMSDTSSPATIRKEVEAWGTIGANVGKALVGAAKEVGVAAAEFASTDLGKVVTAIIVYKAIGESVIGVVVGISFLIVGLLLGFYFFRTTFAKERTYEYKPMLFGLYQRKVVTYSVESSDALVSRILLGVGTLIICSIIGISAIT